MTSCLTYRTYTGRKGTVMNAMFVCENLKAGQTICVTGTSITITPFCPDESAGETLDNCSIIADNALNFNRNNIFEHHIGKYAAAKFIEKHGYTVEEKE